MNIFLLSYERNAHKHFAEQAAFHCDKHVIKMIAESTQMLVTALSSPAMLTRYPGMLTPNGVHTPCKPLSSSHAKHPCMIWTGASIEHTYYLLRLALALCVQKQRRWPLNPDHEYNFWLLNLANQFAKCGFSMADPLPETFPVAVKNELLRSTATPHHQAVAIYRSYYVSDKAGIATWKTNTPIWFIMALEQPEVI